MGDPLEQVGRQVFEDWAGTLRLELGYAGTHTGVVMPRDFSAGEILGSGQARSLAAALIIAVDMHDRIYDRGWEERGSAHERVHSAMQHNDERLQEMRELLNEVHSFLEDIEVVAGSSGMAMPRLTHVKKLVDKERAH